MNWHAFIDGEVFRVSWMSYHIGEEFLITALCLAIARRAYMISRSAELKFDFEAQSRTYLISAGFVLLGISSLLHAIIHATHVDLNLLYQTLVGYCLGLLTIIVAFFTEKPWKRKWFPLLYIPLLFLLMPDIYEQFPTFAKFRPLVWIVVSYFSGVVSILYIAAYYQTRLNTYLLSAVGHILICFSSIALFFPTAIGSSSWIYGHLLRPVGFTTLFFSMNREELVNLRGSIIYKFFTAFSLLAAFPLLAFGMVIFYESVRPITIVSKNIMIFILMIITLVSALIFGLGLIIRMMRPIIRLKDAVDKVADDKLDERLIIDSNDEIGKLSAAFNEMVAKLKSSFAERDRLSRLAATGELSATLAHEIKNPLNAIGGAATYIKKNFKGSLINEFADIITDEAARINKLTANLLSFSKPTKHEPRPSDINKLVGETVNLLRQECDDGQSIETDLQEGIPQISFDYDQIKQVLINLILNSLDALGQDGRIIVSTRAFNGNIDIAVKDNGIGISRDDMSNIFNPFFTTKTRGTGLGLAISKKAVMDHGGDIEVESSPEKGSTFTVHLPVGQ